MEKKVIAIIEKVINDNDIKPIVDSINKDTDLIMDLNFDSFNMAQLTVELEAEFGVDIFESGLISNVQEILSKLV